MVVVIQKMWRGFSTRRNLMKLKDGMDFHLLNILLERYNNDCILVEGINKQLKKKKIRNSNFPSEISENIAKLAICKKYRVMPTWDTERGDLYIQCPINRQVEVKGFMSVGPSSFGPTERWDWIYFVDCINTLQREFKVYEIKLSNTNMIWRNIMVNKEQTYGDQCDQKRRPRIAFHRIQEQIPNHCKLIFEGNIEELQ